MNEYIVSTRDVDPDPVGYAFIWVFGSESVFRMQIRIQGYKIKKGFNQKKIIAGIGTRILSRLYRKLHF